MKRTRTGAAVGLGLLTAISGLGCDPSQMTPTDDAAGKALVANLRGADGAVADLEFRDGGGHTEFSLAIHGGTPGATVDVTVGGVVVLSITLDDFGNARVDFDSDPNELGEDALPASFPGANGGDSVGVGELNGSFEDKEDGNSDDNANGDDDEGGKDDADEIELEAEMVAPDSSLRAKVKFESGGVKLELEVRVRGGAPASTDDFVLEGVTLGTLTLDEFGSGKLRFDSQPESGELAFPAGFVAPVAGAAVSVGPLSGTLETASDGENHDGDDDNANDNNADDDNAEDDVNSNDNVDNHSNDNADDSEEDNVNGNDNGP